MTLDSVPGYERIADLGAGAQARVILARSTRSGETVAIKLLAASLLSDQRAVSMFRDEARLLQQVENPYVARLYDYIEIPSGSAIVMEAINGISLRKLLDQRDDPLEIPAALTLLKGSLLGLAAAHSRGVVHRDYKPANVIVQDDGQTKLIDFGVAGLTGSSSTSGTPSYMAPEQWRGEPASPATDLYAATCVFFECLTGRRPYEGRTVHALQAAHLMAPIPLADVPEALHPIVTRGMAKNPGERLWSATEFIAEVEVIAAREYGSDWESRGLAALGAAAAVFAAAFPLAAAGSALLAPGASAVGSTLAQAGAAGQSAGGGLLTKLGGGKVVSGVSAFAATAGVVTWLLWPSPPQVGGSTSGAVVVGFNDPVALLRQPNLRSGGAGSPSMNVSIKVTPSRVRPGTRVHVVSDVAAITPNGVRYLPDGSMQCLGANSRAPGANRAYRYGFGQDHDLPKGRSLIWLYPAPKEAPATLPTSTSLPPISAKSTPTVTTHYDRRLCADRDTFHTVFDFQIPAGRTLRPGDYYLSPYDPPRISYAEAAGSDGRLVSLSPESLGAHAAGTLPVITVLKS